MEITLKNQFITLWNTYFPQAGLPITFQYSADTQNLPIVEAPKGHRCIIAQLTQVQRGKTLCMQADSVGCRGGKRYTNFTDKMFPGFECFLSHNEQGEGERSCFSANPQQNGPPCIEPLIRLSAPNRILFCLHRFG